MTIADVWNSPEQLAVLSRILQLVTVVLGLMTAVLGAGSFVVGQRKSRIDDTKRHQMEQRVQEVETRATDITPLSRRRLSVEQISAINDALNGTEGTTVMIIRNNSAESQDFSQQLERILSEHGWKLEHLLPGSLRKPCAFRIGRNDSVSESKSFEALKRALSKGGVAFECSEFSSDFSHEILIDVGVLEATPYQGSVLI